MLKSRMRRRRRQPLARPVLNVVMWVLLAVLAANRFGLLSYEGQQLFSHILWYNVGLSIIALTVMGVFLTCIDVEIVKRHGGALNVMAVFRSLLIVVAAIDLLFIIVIR